MVYMLSIDFFLELEVLFKCKQSCINWCLYRWLIESLLHADTREVKLSVIDSIPGHNLKCHFIVDIDIVTYLDFVSVKRGYLLIWSASIVLIDLPASLND